MRATTQRLEFIQNYLTSYFGGDLHAKRVCSLSLAVLGVMSSASLAVAVIDQALAQERGNSAKHAIKQVDRLLSNQGVEVWELFPLWIAENIGASRDLVVAMDWTEFDADDQSTLTGARSPCCGSPCSKPSFRASATRSRTLASFGSERRCPNERR